MDIRKLINVRMKDGSERPILDVTADNIDREMEIVEQEDGSFKIQLKEKETTKEKTEDENFGL